VKEKKQEIREQREKLDRLQVCAAEMVPIYHGSPLKMEPVVLTYITSEKRVGSILRNFLRYYYTDSELRTSTVSGKDCQANKNPARLPLAGLEPVKFQAIMGKHHFQ
jgi:hypothetical protein